MSTDRPTASPVRVVVRPIATPLPLGFLALAVATLAFASLQLEWVAQDQGRTIALGVLVLTVPLQLLASVMGFLARDPVAATGMGILAGTWGAICLATITSPPGTKSAGLGIILLGSAGCLLIPAAAAHSKLVLMLVILTSSVRYAVTGLSELDAGSAWTTTAGWVGVALAAISLYAALALELEGSQSRTVLPLGRNGAGRAALDGRLTDQTEQLSTEPGVRQQL